MMAMRQDDFLPLILEWDMNKDEAFAFRLALLYLQLAREYFPNYKHVGLPKRGDPRKCELFKYCWTLTKDTKDKLALEEYRSYMCAQFAVLKNIKVGDYHPLIHPRCLVGGQAWRRWLLWKKHYEEVKKTITPEEKIDRVPIIKKALKNTHYLLKLRLKEITAENLKEMMKSKFFFRLVQLGGISMYFVALSPTVREYMKENNVAVDFIAHEKQITPEIKDHYKKLFGEI